MRCYLIEVGDVKLMTRSVRIARLLLASKSDYPWRRASFPGLLNGLVAEARKASSFDEFRKDYLIQIKHGLYWHWTDDPDFRIDLAKGPRDLSSMASGEMTPGKLMVTSHLENWADYGSGGKGRQYAALIDMSDVPRDQYRQVSRGFGNEFFVNDPGLARVVKVYPRSSAFRVDNQHHKLIPQSEEALRDFYQFVTGEEN
jgi:hypothetical protein